MTKLNCQNCEWKIHKIEIGNNISRKTFCVKLNEQIKNTQSSLCEQREI